jgi:hypothetical protein
MALCRSISIRYRYNDRTLTGTVASAKSMGDGFGRGSIRDAVVCCWTFGVSSGRWVGISVDLIPGGGATMAGLAGFRVPFFAIAG